jgi:hypothetical protein
MGLGGCGGGPLFCGYQRCRYVAGKVCRIKAGDWCPSVHTSGLFQDLASQASQKPYAMRAETLKPSHLSKAFNPELFPWCPLD